MEKLMPHFEKRLVSMATGPRPGLKGALSLIRAKRKKYEFDLTMGMGTQRGHALVMAELDRIEQVVREAAASSSAEPTP